MGLTKISGGVIQSDNFSVGVITATSLQIGSATTIHTTGIDLGSGNVTSHNINSTGIITAASFGAINGTTASFSGDVSIGGTLTYDDVTNIDSIGVVTARSGIHVTGVGASVGIGTDNPRTDLQVGAFGGGDSNIQLATGTSGASNILFGDGSGGSDYYKGFIKYNHSTDNLELYTTNNLIHYTGGSERLRITGIGSVGIGTNNPATQLDVVGGITIRNGSEHNAIRTTPDGKLQFLRNGAANNQVTVTIDDANGNVGIGSTIPTQALDVAGRITKTEYEPGEIIERLCAVCDGSTHVVKSGSYTMTNVTGGQSGTTSDAVCSGSSIDYKCPAGAKRIHYEYWFKWEATERSGLSHFFIEVDGADVVPSRRTFATNHSRYSTTYYHHGEGWYCMNWVFECDASSTDTSEGQYDSWASSEQTKTIRTVFREYTGSYEIVLHTNYYWDGTTASGANHGPIKPMLIITTTA